MKKVTLIAFVLGSYWLPLHAQVIEVTPIEFDTSSTPDDNDIGYALHIKNISSDSLYLYWSKRLNGAPAEWLSWVCDPNQCYVPEVQTLPLHLPNRMGPGDVIEISTHVNPLQVAGSGEFTLNLLDSLYNNLETVTGTFIAEITATHEPGISQSIVSPNPANTFFQPGISGLSTVELIDLSGTVIRTYARLTVDRIPIADVNEGLYIVRITDDRYRSTRISKLLIQR